VLPPIVLRIYRGFGRSWNYVAPGFADFERLAAGDRPLVGAFLHARTFPLLYYFSRPGRGRWILMCSQSRDGEAMARLEEGLGFRVARGSSGKGGARALVEMIKAQREDRKLGSCLAVDGSRGPRGIAQFGVLTLAQKTGGLVLPVAASTRNPWIWKNSWDRTVIPRFGAEIHVRFGEPFEVPPRIDAAGLEALRTSLEATLLGMHAQLDAETGYADTEPLRALVGGASESA
jgi:lysophospholipid acyltransferase (LPLAT)-like uncharacterized protein